MLAFPNDYKTLVPKLLIETMQAVGASFISRINLATGDVIPETKALAKGLKQILSPSFIIFILSCMVVCVVGWSL